MITLGSQNAGSRVTRIKRQVRGRSAVEPVVRHLGAEHRIGRNYLARPVGNALLAGAGYSFSLLIR